MSFIIPAFLLLLLSNTSLASDNFQAATTHILTVGQSLRLPSTGQVQVEKNNNLKIKSEGTQLRLIALKPGASSLQIGSKRHEIHILSERQRQSYSFLKSWITRHPGLQVEVERGEVILTGQAFRTRSWIGIPELCPRCLYSSRFKVAEERQDEFRHDLQIFLKKRSLPSPSLRFGEQLIWSLPASEKHQALLKLSENLGIHPAADEGAVEVAPLVRTQIFVMEVRRDFTRKYGIEWPSSVTAQLLGENSALSPLGFSAHALEAEGQAKILANPSLLCRSGQEAEFFAGGEFPIKILNYRSQDLVWKKYGISLKVKPRADRFGRMSLSLETEISSVDDSRKVDGLPGLFTNRVFSHFDLEGSATIAISGLIKNEQGRSAQGLPGLAKLPILGALFSSEDFRENRTELVILVRPEVVDLQADNLNQAQPRTR